jgi:hypothetical protein
MSERTGSMADHVHLYILHVYFLILASYMLSLEYHSPFRRYIVLSPTLAPQEIMHYSLLVHSHNINPNESESDRDMS